MTTAVAIAQSLERRERSRGMDVQAARSKLAGQLKVGIGTVENLIRGRVKRVDETIRDRLCALLIRETEAEIRRLQHDLDTLRQSGAHLASSEVAEVETLLERAKAILTGGAL